MKRTEMHKGIHECTFDNPGFINPWGHCDHTLIGMTWCCYCRQQGNGENFAPCVVRGDS